MEEQENKTRATLRQIKNMILRVELIIGFFAIELLIKDFHGNTITQCINLFGTISLLDAFVSSVVVLDIT